MESITKFRNVIESLQKEKEELNKRLIKANHDKLSVPVAQQQENDVFNQTMDYNRERENEKTGFYLWNCGIVNSTVELNSYLREKKLQKPNPKKQFRVEYVFNLSQYNVDECMGMQMKNELKNSKQ